MQPHQLRSGAWISTAHDWGGYTLRLTDVDGAESWTELYDHDPFDGFKPE